MNIRQLYQNSKVARRADNFFCGKTTPDICRREPAPAQWRILCILQMGRCYCFSIFWDLSEETKLPHSWQAALQPWMIPPKQSIYSELWMMQQAYAKLVEQASTLSFTMSFSNFTR